ncbi:hypothetical protein HYDPIDRAFT_138540 [Hydnomerulius pinastri MD-312]|uniref:Uncharacterized protein n=1 Tax=Hydnomerulius pinastri MD-312 TaxID=994086 RepID=A0A0C9V5K8_9AGAM|nr:hypothetical protein HYDPIDRAFT_138540 [Hydnomerulius pinastri MD-312]
MTIDSLPPSCPHPIPLPHSADSLKERSLRTFSEIFKANSISTFYLEAPHLQAFRDALTTDDTQASCADNLAYDLYRCTVPIMTYEEYRPFIARFREDLVELDVVPVSAVNNLFAPGLPAFIAHSSGTSGGLPKWFAKYGMHPNGNRSCCAVVTTVRQSMTKDTICIISSLLSKKILALRGPDGEPVTHIPVCPVSTGTARAHSGRDVMSENSLLPLKVPHITSPLAANFIPEFSTFMVIHVLFALADPRLLCISCVFATAFRDFYRILEERWDLLVQAIEDGVIPDLAGLDGLKEHLQAHFAANTQRAHELRAAGRDTTMPGWMKKIWPELHRVVATTSGAYATILPEMRHYLGPDVEIHSLGITSTESYYALPFHSLDGELYRISDGDDFVEFLPLGEDRKPSSIKALWEVSTGEAYELLLTTHDGLWRYAVGDIVTIAGFDPRDGQPVIRFTGRTSSDFRLAHTVIPEKDVLDAVQAAQTYTGPITEFTATADFRKPAVCHGFFIELQEDSLPRPDAHRASDVIRSHLSAASFNYAQDVKGGRVGPPTVRVVRKGTFMEYRQWKGNQVGTGFLQIKIPMVTWDKTLVAWLEERVVREL